MKWTHLLVAGAPGMVLQFAVGAPAHASAAVLMGLPLASVTALARQAPAPSASPCGGLAAAPFETAAAFGQSKSSAILNGTPSRLELISSQQSGAAQAAPPLIGAKVEPAAGGVRCRVSAQPWSMTVQAQPALPRAAISDEFLGTARLPLRKTSFDAQWNKVSRAGLSAQALSSLASRAAGRPTGATLAAVNAWSNARIRYREDRDLYGKPDHWASAASTLRRGAGDCEDIAIVKLQALAALGVPRSDMYLTIARDMVRNADHALLVVRLDGRYWLLDDATDTVLDAAASYDYRPIMSFSTSGKWLHGYARAPHQLAVR